MKTYKDLLNVLQNLSDKQLNQEIKFIAVGCSEFDAPTLSCEEIAESFDLVLAEDDIIYTEFPEDSYQESGYTDAMSLDELEQDKEDGQVNSVAVAKGDPFFRCNVDY